MPPIFNLPPSIAKQTYGWPAMRFVIAAILLAAAFMKAHELATTPSLGEGLLHARWFNILVVEFELLFGIWLIFGMLPQLTWLASISLFSIFATVSLYKAILGSESCGCFGTVEIHPFYTISLDLTIIFLLAYFRPNGDFRRVSQCFSHIPARTLFLYLGLSIIVGVFVFEWLSQMRIEQLNQIGQVLKGNIVQLEPTLWIGKEFPLRDFVADGTKLMNGRWFVLFTRSGCSDCAFIERTLDSSTHFENHSIAILSVTNQMSSIPYPNNRTERFQLLYEIVWIIETPLLLEIRDGVIQNVQDRKCLMNNTKEHRLTKNL